MTVGPEFWLPRQRPTMYFIGVTTSKSSIMKVFPRWSEILGLDAEIVGYDAPLHAQPEIYRAIVAHIKQDPVSRGALVTTHKIDLLEATRDLFDTLDYHAELCGEVSSISKSDGKLAGHAIDPISAGLAWQAFIEPDYFGETGAHVLCLGAGGSATAISDYLAGRPEATDRPARFTVVSLATDRLERLKAIHARLNTNIQFEYVLNSDPRKNDQLMAALPEGSVVVNATGMGKDTPGSPITDDGVFPHRGRIWELNYRGELDFLHQAKRQAAEQNLHVEDGWVYFLHGWTQVVAKVFHFDLTADLFGKLAEAASIIR